MWLIDYVVPVLMGFIAYPAMVRVVSKRAINRVNGLILPLPSDPLWKETLNGNYVHPARLTVWNSFDSEWPLEMNGNTIPGSAATRYVQEVIRVQRQRSIDECTYRALIEG